MTMIASFLLDFGNSPIMLILISCHDPSSIFKGCNSLVFFMCCTLFVGIWSILECISWYCSLFLATSSFFWSASSFVVVLDVLYLLDHGFLEGFSLWSFGYLACRFFYLHRWFYFPPIIVCLSFPVLYILSVLLFHFIVFLLV